MKDDDRRLILSRRARFVAAALASAGLVASVQGCGGQTDRDGQGSDSGTDVVTPQPCLGAPADAEPQPCLKQQLDAEPQPCLEMQLDAEPQPCLDPLPDAEPQPCLDVEIDAGTD